MKILVVNDDGIHSPGIERLARMATNFGEVTVVAPATQCSAMSQRITVFDEMTVKKESFPVEGVKAYSLTGTPADCVKVALRFLYDENDKPDFVFSGINHGYNAGYDILYSGTIGATFEALSEGVKAMAFSSEMNDDFRVVDEYILKITQELIKEELPKNALWNINFPGCSIDELKGIKRDVKIADKQLYQDNYLKEEIDSDSFILRPRGIPLTDAPKDTDIGCLGEKYITIGIVESAIIKK